MKNKLRKLIIGSPLESMTRKIYSLLTIDRRAKLYDIQTFEIMKRVLKDNSNCIDVGCHEGSILKEILFLAPKGNHFAFEPIPKMYKGLLESFGNFKNVHIHDLALSDIEGETSFQYVVNHPAYSGLRNRKYPQLEEKIQEIVVKINLLDNIIPDDNPIHFMKVDVEGAEYLVFKGAVKILSRYKPVIVFEHGLGAADYYGTDSDDIYELLVLQCGLRLFLMADWLKDSQKAPLTQQAFCEQFRKGKNYYFMACP